MKIFEKRNTSEVKSRRRRFFAFCLVLIISMLPAATVFAENIDLGVRGAPVDKKNNTVNGGDEFVFGSGFISVSYFNSDSDYGGFGEGHYIVESINTEDGTVYSNWKIDTQTYNASQFTVNLVLVPNTDSGDSGDSGDPGDPGDPVQPVNPSPSQKDKKDNGSSRKKKHSQSPTSWEGNPDEITAFYFKNGVMDPKAKFGKQEQGDACKLAFAANLPAGWKQAFTFSMSVDGKHTTDLKDGKFMMYVPSSLQMAGRQFAIMAIDKNSKVHIYNDSDPQASVIASQLNFEGYAFCLIYKD